MSNLFVDNFGKRDQSAKITADTLLQGTAKAWFNLNGTGTIAVRDSFNVSSFTDNGTGNYRSTFATAFPNANYSAAQCCGNGLAFAGASCDQVDKTPSYQNNIYTWASSITISDINTVQYSFFGDPI